MSKTCETMPFYADDMRTTTTIVSAAAAGGGAWCHPALVLFGLAVATTLVKRTYANLYNDRAAITGRMLQETICVVICVPQDACALTKYTEKLFTYARWPQRLRIRLRKLVAEGEATNPVAIEDMLSEGRAVQGKHNSVKVEFRMRKTDDADELVRETMRLALDVHKKQDSKYMLILSHQPVDVVQDWDVHLVAMLQQCDEYAPSRSSGHQKHRRGAILTCDPPANTQSLNPGASLPMARFLRLSSSETSIDSIDFANQPARPQPSLFCSVLFLFGESKHFGCLPTSLDVVRKHNIDLLLSRALWMSGVNLYNPQTSVVLTDQSARLRIKPGQTQRGGDTTSSSFDAVLAATSTGNDHDLLARTSRQWHEYVSRDFSARGKYKRRSFFGLTPSAKHEERFSKYGDAIQLYVKE